MLRNGAAENSGIMLSKFRHVPNLTSRHKHSLSITPKLSKRNNFESTHLTYVAHMKRGGSKQVTHMVSQLNT
jgi:hypothetical protein